MKPLVNSIAVYCNHLAFKILRHVSGDCEQMSEHPPPILLFQIGTVYMIQIQIFLARSSETKASILEVSRLRLNKFFPSKTHLLKNLLMMIMTEG